MFGPLPAEVITGAVGFGAPHQLRQGLGQSAPAMLSLAQRFLGALAFGNVPHHGHPETAAALPERLAPDLDREDSSILAAVSGLQRIGLSGEELADGILIVGWCYIGVKVERGHGEQLVA